MIVEVISEDAAAAVRTQQVYGLHYDPSHGTFSMGYCVGDDWGQVLRCPLTALPTRVDYHADRRVVQFERREEASAFLDWLREAEAIVQHGFRTMRD